jgi:hypothetical protein
MRTRLGVEATRQTKFITRIDRHEKKMLGHEKKSRTWDLFLSFALSTKILSNRMSMLVKKFVDGTQPLSHR